MQAQSNTNETAGGNTRTRGIHHRVVCNININHADPKHTPRAHRPSYGSNGNHTGVDTQHTHTEHDSNENHAD